MARSEKNVDYLDQVYYAIGNVYMSQQDTIRAIESYESAIEKSRGWAPSSMVEPQPHVNKPPFLRFSQAQDHSARLFSTLHAPLYQSDALLWHCAHAHCALTSARSCHPRPVRLRLAAV